MDFVLRTTDQQWIARNNGQIDADGKVTVQVPDDQVERVPFAGRDWLQHRFTDCPKDAANPSIMCPITWVA